MSFRYNETDVFPFELRSPGVWYAILRIDPIHKGIVMLDFTSSKSQKKMLTTTLLKDDILIGVWTGRWSTDLFILDKTIALKKLMV